MKLGIIKQFIKVLQAGGDFFMYSILAFPGLSIERN